MRVLHYELQYRIGGIESFLLNLSKYIDTDYIRFDFVMNGDNEKIESDLKALNSAIYKYNGVNKIKKIVKILSLIKKEKYDFVHFHKNSAADIVLPVMVKIFTGAKVIIHSHNTQPSTKSTIKVILHLINKKILPLFTDYYWACSELAAKWMFPKSIINSQKAVIIRNGIDVDAFKFCEKIRNEYRLKLGLDDRIVIGTVGALRAQKNHKFLIDLLALLDDQYYLVIVGEGPLEAELKEYTKEKQLNERVVFLGARNDVNCLLQAFDFYLMPSLWEGLPVSAIEAQCADLHVLLSSNTSKMTKQTDKTVFLDIKEPNVWKDYIIAHSSSLKRGDIHALIEKNGYSMKSSSMIVSRLYGGYMDES